MKLLVQHRGELSSYPLAPTDKAYYQGDRFYPGFVMQATDWDVKPLHGEWLQSMMYEGGEFVGYYKDEETEFSFCVLPETQDDQIHVNKHSKWSN